MDKQTPTNEWGSIAYRTQISIGLKSSENVFKTNQIVKVLVRIRNLSTNEACNIYVQRAFANNEDFSFIVSSPSGKDMSPVFHKTDVGSGGIVFIPPNQINGFQFDLNEICKTDKIGTYKIIMKMQRWSPTEKKSFEVISKPLYVTIVN